MAIAKQWMAELFSEGKKYGTVYSYYQVIKSSFQIALEEGYIAKNPFAFKLSSIIMKRGDGRRGLTIEEMNGLLEYIKANRKLRKYYDMVYTMFHTGLRVGEICGLTVGAVDLGKNCISVYQQIQRNSERGKVVVEPKTKAGVRRIPIDNETAACIKRAISSRNVTSINREEDFVFLSSRGLVMSPRDVQRVFSYIMGKYNSDGMPPLPNVTPHICRHTFCCNMVRLGMTPKTLQYIMGHESAAITMDVYTHLNYDDVERDARRVLLA